MADRTQNNDLFLKGIGSEIKRLRKARSEAIGRKYTQQDLCNDFSRSLGYNLDMNTISRIERGKQEPSLSLAIDLSFLLCEGRDWKKTLSGIAEAGIRNDLARMDSQSAALELLGSMSRYLEESLRVSELLFELVEAARTEGMLEGLSEEERQLLEAAGVAEPERGSYEILGEIFSVMDMRKPAVSEPMLGRIAQSEPTANQVIGALATPAPTTGRGGDR